jgi:hypothetical protein
VLNKHLSSIGLAPIAGVVQGCAARTTGFLVNPPTTIDQHHHHLVAVAAAAAAVVVVSVLVVVVVIMPITITSS